MKKEAYLVTGAAGFIGFHLCELLIRNGKSVLGIDCLSDYYDVALKKARLGRLDKHDEFEVIIGDLQDDDTWAKVTRSHKVKKVFHLAAQAGVRHSIDHPLEYLNANVIGTFKVLEFCVGNEIEHLMLASTSSVYGDCPDSPLGEKAKTDHQMSFYAATKKATEVMAHSYAHIHQLPITAFRFFTVYGPWGRPDMALFKFTESILKGRSIEVYNQGDMKRDFTYIDDLCAAILDLSYKNPPITIDKARNNPLDSDSLSQIAPFRVVNIGSNNPVSLRSFIEVIEEELGIKSNKVYLPMQQGDIKETHASIDLLEKLTGPRQVTPLKVGVKLFVNWYKDYYNVTEQL